VVELVVPIIALIGASVTVLTAVPLEGLGLTSMVPARVVPAPANPDLVAGRLRRADLMTTTATSSPSAVGCCAIS
jgi:hypothetical protein